jgi:transposase-like protein
MDNILDYTYEFKYKVVLEVLEEKMSIAKIATHYKIEPFLIRRWKLSFVDIMKKTLAEKNNKIESIEDHYNRQLLQLNKKIKLLENSKGVEKFGKEEAFS